MLLGIVFCIAVSFLSFEGECQEIRDSVLRLHILANSDSAQDQNIKLMVRDRILEVSEEIFCGCSSYDDAKAAACENLEIFKSTAEQVLRENGCQYDVTVRLADSWFTTRSYDDVTLPAGMYEALRIEIGAAQGHNWWCVMFPTVCIPTATGESELSTVLSAEQVEIVCGDGYELKFRCVELYEQLIEEIRHACNED